MGKIILYTVQGNDEIPGYGYGSMADEIGLTDYLGYRPFFCTRIDPDSIAESWFRIWAASPQRVDKIIMFEIEESECIPMNIVDWSNNCLGHSNDTETLKAVLNNDQPTMTDYLVKDIPEDCFEIPFATIAKSSHTFNTVIKNPIVVEVLENTRKSIVSSLKKSEFSTVGKVTSNSIPDKVLYRSMCLTGIVPFLWYMITKKTISASCFAITFEDHKMTALIEAEKLMMEWDNAIETGENFSYENYGKMRDAFISSVNSASEKTMKEFAKMANISRNDKCFCGSNMKFKHCCGRKTTIDSLIREV